MIVGDPRVYQFDGKLEISTSDLRRYTVAKSTGLQVADKCNFVVDIEAADYPGVEVGSQFIKCHQM